MDIHLKSRIQVEYSSFIVRTCHVIYNARSLGIWQYLVDLPFKDLNTTILWNLYYSFNVGFEEQFVQKHFDDISSKVEEDYFLVRFNDMAIELKNDDLYYLLQTFGNMILSRTKDDWEFIKIVSLRLFEACIFKYVFEFKCTYTYLPNYFYFIGWFS